ncbi:MAG TPA: hypothetical protein PKC13_28835 [Blastocatellia bacterium]|nr:hypothetical protein [Blastocatellia bacterium]HMV87921.1 hypothetical protein [Blastocatellia bacterium]HMX29626.1 hypothetical protein [Blastocatellia bacterium]HMY73873.1 hypothetical protein [Blastocatellia bacterium]
MPVYSRELSAAEIADMIAGTAYVAVPNLQGTRVDLLVVFGNGCTAGAVALKAGPAASFAGAWAELASAVCPGAPPGANGTVVVVGVQTAVGFVRAELKTALAGGTITRVVVYAS